MGVENLTQNGILSADCPARSKVLYHPLIIKRYSTACELPFVVSVPTVILPSLFSEMNE